MSELFNFLGDQKTTSTLPEQWQNTYMINIPSNSNAHDTPVFAELSNKYNFPRTPLLSSDWNPTDQHTTDQVDTITKVVGGGAYKVEYYLFLGQSGRFYLKQYNNAQQCEWCGDLKDGWMWVDFSAMARNYCATTNGQHVDAVIRDVHATALGVVVVCKDLRVFFVSLLNQTIQITKMFDYGSRRLSAVSHSMMGSRIMLASGGGPIEVFDIESKTSSHVPVRYNILSEPKFMGCFHENCDIMVSKHNEIYVRAKRNSYGVGDERNDDSFNLVRADLDAPIIDLKTGYSHYVVLLSNGKVFAHGFNSLCQCGVPHSIESVTNPTQMLLPSQVEDSFVTGIWCASRGTVLRTRRELIFYGEKVDTYQNAISFGDIKYVLVIPLDESVEVDIATKPWSYIIYGRLRNQKSLMYFQENMKKFSTEMHFGGDVTVGCFM